MYIRSIFVRIWYCTGKGPLLRAFDSFVRLLFKETVDYLLLGFFFRQAEGHELRELLAGDLADRRFVNERGETTGRARLP